MPALDPDLRKELVYDLLQFVLSNKRLMNRDTPRLQALRLCKHLMSDDPDKFGTTRNDWLIQEMKKDSRIWSTFSQFLRNTDGACAHCPHSWYYHGAEALQTPASERDSLSCRGGYRRTYSKKDDDCKCPGYEPRPL